MHGGLGAGLVINCADCMDRDPLARANVRACGEPRVASRGCSGSRDGLSSSMPLTRTASQPAAGARRSRHRGGERARAHGVRGRARGGEHTSVATAATPTERLRLRSAMLDNFLPRFARFCSVRSRARGFALRSAHGGAHGGAHGDGKRRAEPHTYQSKFSAGVVLREHTTQQPDRRIDTTRGEQPAHSLHSRRSRDQLHDAGLCN